MTGTSAARIGPSEPAVRPPAAAGRIARLDAQALPARVMAAGTPGPAGATFDGLLPPGATAVLAHGAGSSPDLIRRAFGPALEPLGVRLVTWQQQPDPSTWLPELDALVSAHEATLVGGVSLGAHLAAAWAVARIAATADAPEAGPEAGAAGVARGMRRTGAAPGPAASGSGPAGGVRSGARPVGPTQLGPVHGLLLVLPGWTGRPRRHGAAAGPRVTADAVDRHGVAATLETVRQEAPGWVAAEMAAAWTRWPPAALAAHLRAAAGSRAPVLAELRTVSLPTGVVAVREDALHPARVGAAWARALPCSVLARLDLTDLGRDRAVLGSAAVTAWRAAVCDASFSAPR